MGLILWFFIPPPQRLVEALYGVGAARKRGRPKNLGHLARNRKFESISLQRRVRSEPALWRSARSWCVPPAFLLAPVLAWRQLALRAIRLENQVSSRRVVNQFADRQKDFLCYSQPERISAPGNAVGDHGAAEREGSAWSARALPKLRCAQSRVV
jgi:hypothetical protein